MTPCSVRSSLTARCPMWGDAMVVETDSDVKAIALAALLTENIPGIEWVHGDDLCDCTFQRIGEWTNPYIAKTLRVRFCCIWEELFKQYPEYVQRIDAYYDENAKRFVTEPWEWNGDDDMPRALWHRHLASKTGRSLSEVRQEYADQEPPKGVKRWKSPLTRFSRFTVNLR